MKSKILAYLKKWFQGVNMPILIIAVVISFSLWYVNKLGHTYTATVTLPVEIENTADNTIGVIYEDHEVECRIEGTGYQLLRYSLFPKRNGITVNLRRIDLRPVEHSSRSEVSLNSLYNAISEQLTDVRLLSILTTRFEITTSPLNTKMLPVRSQFTIDLRNPYMLIGLPRLIPDSMEVKSLGIILDTMQAVYTEPRHFNNVNGSLSGRISLVQTPEVMLPQTEVDYVVTVEEYTEVDLVLPLTLHNGPSGMVPVILPEEVSVKLHVSRSKYASASSGEITAYIDYEDRNTNIGKQYKVHVPAGEGIVVKEITPLYVELVFQEATR